MTATVDAPAAALAARRPIVIEKPGVYDIPEDQYHADPVPQGSLSSSGARRLLDAPPAVFDWERRHNRLPTEAMQFGTAAHSEILGTGAEVVPIEFDNYQKKAAQEARDEAIARGAIPMLPHQLEAINAMGAALRAHPLASALLGDWGRPEQSVFWRDRETGVICRSRYDVFPTGRTVRGRVLIPDYKGLALDTPIPTPSGWSTMGALNVGDEVFDAAGQPCVVTHKSEVHMRRCYRLRFDDGSSVIADDEHLWITAAGRKGEKIAVRDTEEIRGTLKLYGQSQHRIAVAEPLELPEVPLPIHPYVLGCWLGDGAAACGRISKPDEELFDLIAACGYGLGKPWVTKTRCLTRTVLGLSAQLRHEGLLGHKHIPAAYLRAGYRQRLALLRGLMDTDGSWNSTRQQAVFSSTDKALALSVRELACSLGQRAVVHEIQATGFGRTVTAHHVTFTPTRGLNPFKLSRKASKVSVRSETFSLRRVVVAVDEMPTVPTQCITVDSPSSTYLCTEAMIPTHNTAKDAGPEAFSKAVHERGYHQQAPFYLDGLRALGLAGDNAAFAFIVQEKTPPYLVAVYQLDAAALLIGANRNRKALRIYAECTASGRWPGYSPDIETVCLPAWAEKQAWEDGQL